MTSLAPARYAVALLLVTIGTNGQQGDCGLPGSEEVAVCRAPAGASQRADRAKMPSAELPVVRDLSDPRAEAAADPRANRDRPVGSDMGSPREPAEPTEFQQFVAQSTGKMLPIFGADLFQDVPSTFAPVDRIPVTPDYPIGPGDQLVIRGWGQIDLQVSPVVDRNGSIYIPQIGEVRVAGLKYSQIRGYLTSAIGRVYRNFELSVSMGQLRSIQVFVMGHARRPGAYTVSSLSTLVNAIFASGGPAPNGSMRGIRLRRGDSVVAEFDLYDLLVNGDKSKDKALLPGDVIYIPPAGPQVALAGSFNNPAIYELNRTATLQEVEKIAGGTTPVAARQRVFIERANGPGRRVILTSLNSEDSGRTVLENGDIVSVLSVVPRFENAVTLRGNVADPIRVPWRPGMKILDLIPDASVLASRDYWLARNRLKSPNETPAASPEQFVNGERGPQQNDRSTVTLASMLRPGSTPSAGVPPQSRAAPGPISAANDEPSSTGNRPERSDLEVNWSYAVVERLSPADLRTTLIPFHLGRAVLDRDESENLPLEPGDIVTVFSTSDLRAPQKTRNRYIRLEGEIESAGVYTVRPGETLRQLVKRAGGFTAQAYLFGSEFLRESSRTDQQQRLDDLVNSLERDMTTSSANVLGEVISQEQAAAAVQQTANQRELVEKLRRVRAAGRIVLGLEPSASGVDDLPDLPLEDGDVFTVPSTPSFVNVVGSVYNSTSFVYEDGRRAGDYLRKAGGPTRSADKGSMFMIRADGSVISKSWKSGIFSRGMEDLPLSPGDTVVVPDEINRTTFLKGLKDWSLVFAQFGLGAAAINVLR